MSEQRSAGEPSGHDPEPSELLQEAAAGTAAPSVARLAGGTNPFAEFHAEVLRASVTGQQAAASFHRFIHATFHHGEGHAPNTCELCREPCCTARDMCDYCRRFGVGRCEENL